MNKLFITKAKSWLLSPLSISILAGIVYGSWAAYANHEYGHAVMLSAGLGQGVYAFFSTWFVTVIAEKILCYCGTGYFGLITSFMASFSVMLIIPIAIHTNLNTPNMWQAMLPGLLWGSLYIAVYIIRRQQSIISSLT